MGLLGAPPFLVGLLLCLDDRFWLARRAAWLAHCSMPAFPPGRRPHSPAARRCSWQGLAAREQSR
eukprot:15451313-Alexandrium_andersonii.AAC.1